jgi:hypothetical protein
VSQAVYLDPSRRVVFVDAVIASGASLSGAVPLRSYRLAGVIMSAAWTAASLTFQGSRSETGTYANVFDGATEVAITVAAGQYQVLSQAQQEELVGLEFIKVRSGTSGTPVAQAADRVLTLVLVASTK